MKRIDKYKFQYKLIVNFIVYILTFSPLILLGLAILAALSKNQLLNRLEIIIIIFTILIFYFIHKKINVIKCAVGEAVTRFIINNYCDKLGYVNLYNLLLKNNKSEYSQIEHLIITPNGIIVLRTKAYDGFEINGHEYYNTWTYTTTDKNKNKTKIQMSNPMKQNSDDIQTIKELLNDESITYYNIVEYIDMVIIKDCDIVNKNSKCIYTYDLPKIIEELILNDNNEKMGKDKITNIIHKLHEVNVKDKKIRKAYLKNKICTEQEK